LRVVLAVLDLNGAEIRIQVPDEQTQHLVRFANAFIEVLERF
jgi:cell division protein ZapA (FtsZ GTPase activity inhibitor)